MLYQVFYLYPYIFESFFWWLEISRKPSQPSWLVMYLCTRMQTVTLPSVNQAQCRAILLIETNALPLCHSQLLNCTTHDWSMLCHLIIVIRLWIYWSQGHVPLRCLSTGIMTFSMHSMSDVAVIGKVKTCNLVSAFVQLSLFWYFYIFICCQLELGLVLTALQHVSVCCLVSICPSCSRRPPLLLHDKGWCSGLDTAAGISLKLLHLQLGLVCYTARWSWAVVCILHCWVVSYSSTVY